MKNKEKYIEQLEDWTRQHKRPRKDKNLVAFLAVRADVAEAMKEGYSIRTIWEHMYEIGRISSQYQTFLKYVNQHIKQRKKAPPETETNSEPESKDSEKSSEQIKKNPPHNDNFTFNKTPKKEDLF